MTEIPTAGGKLYQATVIDLYLRRLFGAATGLHPDADLACSAIKMAVAARGVDAVNEPGWRVDEANRVMFHTDRGSAYTANAFTELCRQLGCCRTRGVRGPPTPTSWKNASAAALSKHDPDRGGLSMRLSGRGPRCARS